MCSAASSARTEVDVLLMCRKVKQCNGMHGATAGSFAEAVMANGTIADAQGEVLAELQAVANEADEIAAQFWDFETLWLADAKTNLKVSAIMCCDNVAIT